MPDAPHPCAPYRTDVRGVVALGYGEPETAQLALTRSFVGSPPPQWDPL